MRVFCALMFVLLGCPVACETVSTPPSESGTQGPVVVFEEDDDPAVAALSFVPDELLIQPYPGVEARALSDLFTQVGATVVDTLSDVDVTVLRVAPERLSSTGQTLVESGLVETVQKNYLFDPQVVPDDPLYRTQSHLTTINASAAWDLTVGDQGVPIAVVDTGVDANHPDLVDKVMDGWNVYNNNADFSDPLGHGTSVAGTAAADSDNELGVAGVAWRNPVIAIRVGNDKGRASSRHLAAGILWAVGHGAKVINVSFAPLWSNRIVRSAAQSAMNRGALVIISAGNGGGTTISRGFSEALFVGAIDGFGRVARFSDKGPFVDLVAPGVGIFTTRLGDSYAPATGTSFAAPVVAGVAGLVWSTNPNLRPTVVRSALLRTLVEVGSKGRDNASGLGLIDAEAAVRYALDVGEADDLTHPTLSIDRPRPGTRITRRTTAAVSATDDDLVADVVMYVDGAAIATDTRRPYRFTIDPGAFSPGAHELSFVAADLSGNASNPAAVSITFAPGTVGGSATKINFKSPRSGSTVTGNVTLQASVADFDGLAVVEWLVDGNSVFAAVVSGQSTGVSYLWRTADVEPGSHDVAITVTDSLGTRTTRSIQLTVRQ